jgi:hypothetical protein
VSRFDRIGRLHADASARIAEQPRCATAARKPIRDYDKTARHGRALLEAAEQIMCQAATRISAKRTAWPNRTSPRRKLRRQRRSLVRYFR